MKWKIYISLCLLSLLCFTCIGELNINCSYGALTTNKFNELKDNLITLKDAGVLPNTFSTQYITNGEYFRTDRYTILITSNYLYLFGCHANSSLITNYNVSSSNAKYNDWCQSDGTQYPYNCGCYRYTLSGTSGQSGIFTLNSETFVYAYTMTEIDTRSLTLEAGGEFGRSVLNNSLRYTPFNNNIQTISNIPLHIENFSRNVNSWRLGSLENFDINTKGYIDIFNGTTWQNIGSINWNSNGEVYINNNRLLYYQAYRIYFHDENYNYTEMYGYYFLPIGVTLSSGDSIVYNGNDNNNSQPIINQLQENNNIWEKAYNDLFTISGDFIQSKINELMQEFQFSGDIEIETAFLNLINSNYQDFKISWPTMRTHFTIKGNNTEQLVIPSGEVNFSKLERENIELKESMKWVRIILGFSVGAIILKNCWLTLLHTLGVGVQVYDANKDESATITISHERDKNGNVHTTKVMKKGNERWTWKK